MTGQPLQTCLENQLAFPEKGADWSGPTGNWRFSRSVVRFACVAVVLCSTGMGQAVIAEEPARPDILLIMPDQMRGDCLSTVGHPAVRTPTLDRLAQRGTLFRRAYSTVPSCIPARYALLTGLYPQTSGVVGFRQKAITSPTMPQLLRDAGYATALVGREMHQSVGAVKLGYQTEIRGSTYVSNDDYTADLKKAVPDMGEIRGWVGRLGLTYNHWQARPWPLTNDLHPTTWVVGKARSVVATAAADQPLFLTASFYAPHPPLFPPAEYFDRYMQQELPPPAHGDWVDWDSLTPRGADGGHRVFLTGETLRRAQAGYYGLIEHIDHEVAPLIDDFISRSVKAGRPWVIVFTTDHGEMMGDHGYFRKCEPFEGSANIPLLIAGSPELKFRGGNRCVRPVCLEDLLPTLIELASAACPAVDGVSLVPVLCGEPQEIRPWLHFEHAPCYSKQQAFHALTDGRFKYLWRPNDGTERLFDLDKDPREEHDLSVVADHHDLLEQWRERLVQRLANRPEGFSDGTRLIPGRPYPPVQASIPR
jgi:arylsulfatase